jgi:hypothetical protein
MTRVICIHYTAAGDRCQLDRIKYYRNVTKGGNDGAIYKESAWTWISPCSTSSGLAVLGHLPLQGKAFVHCSTKFSTGEGAERRKMGFFRKISIVRNANGFPFEGSWQPQAD